MRYWGLKSEGRKKLATVVTTCCNKSSNRSVRKKLTT